MTVVSQSARLHIDRSNTQPSVIDRVNIHDITHSAAPSCTNVWPLGYSLMLFQRPASHMQSNRSVLMKSMSTGLIPRDCLTVLFLSSVFMPSLSTIGVWRHYVCRWVVRPSVDTYFAWRDISLVSGRISLKLCVNIFLYCSYYFSCYRYDK